METIEKANIDWANLGFGYFKTDKRFVANFKNGKWDEGAIVEDENIVLNESAGVLQYAQTCFEGMKAYTTSDGRVVIFRPDMNAKRMADTARRLEMPVFPEERLLIALLLNKSPAEYMNRHVWFDNSRYYIDGIPLILSSKVFREADTDTTAAKLEELQIYINYDEFNEEIDSFIKCNKPRLDCLKNEAFIFVNEVSEKFNEEDIIISFSGGKDSTVTADIVTKALSNPSIVHIFGDTTLEFPFTLEYSSRYRNAHPFAIFQTARNDDQNFYDVCDDIGPPARMMRWCCSMFKTGPIARIISSIYRSRQILTFYGIRKSESLARSRYNRIEGDRKSVV